MSARRPLAIDAGIGLATELDAKAISSRSLGTGSLVALGHHEPELRLIITL